MSFEKTYMYEKMKQYYREIAHAPSGMESWEKYECNLCKKQFHVSHRNTFNMWESHVNIWHHENDQFHEDFLVHLVMDHENEYLEMAKKYKEIVKGE